MTSNTDLGLPTREAEWAVAEANIPTLLMVVYQHTGDPRWLREPYRPTRTRGIGNHNTGGLDAEAQAVLRRAAAQAIVERSRGVASAIDVPTPRQLTQMLTVCMGETVEEEFGEMLRTEYLRRIGRGPVEAPVDADPPEDFDVIIVGAGVAGIVAAHYLSDLGVDYTILERAPTPGGTWRDNVYPGAGVDTPSHLYSFSFARHSWSRYFCLQEEIHGYLDRVMDEVGATDNCEFGCQVLRAEYSTETQRWRLQVRTVEGRIEQREAAAVITAVGILNRPKYPSIAGMDRFGGRSFHSAEWPTDFVVDGKDLAVVGTGASAMQIVPAVVDQARSVTVFQRTPQWVAPFEHLHEEIPKSTRWLLDHSDLYFVWFWLRVFWQFGDRVLDALQVDPDWPHPDRSVNARNDSHRETFTDYIAQKVDPSSELFRRVLPDYPPYGKRILLDNGWYEAIQKPNATLVDEAVVEVVSDGVVTASGTHHAAEAIVWSTGFHADEFIASFEVVGAGGHSLRELWRGDDPYAYLGVGVPNFPNFFMLGGPFSFPGSGSFMHVMEVQMRYVQSLLARMFAEGVDAVEPREDVTREYVDLVDDLHEQMVWTHPGMSTYYRNERGRVVFIMPFRNLDYWRMTQEPKLSDYCCS